jgi:hypothetical protein
MMCLITAFQLKAQATAIWTQHPSFSYPNIGVFGGDNTLHIRFSINTPNPAAEALKPKSVKITLPAGVKVVGASDGIGGLGGSIAPGTIGLVGQEWQISITSMSYNTEVYLKVTLRADECNAQTGSSNVQTAVLSEGTTLITASAGLNVVKPNIIAAPYYDYPPLFDDMAKFQVYHIPLSASDNVGVRSMKITISKDQFTTLYNIKLGNKSITPVDTSATSVVLDLTEDIIGATPISAAYPQTLSFNARAAVRGEHKISAISAYPHTNTCVTNTNLFNLTFSYVTVPGVSRIIYVDQEAMEVHPRTLASMPSAKDGTTTFYVASRRKNGPVGTYLLNMTTEICGKDISMLGEGLGYISYLDTIYYKIGDEKVKAIDPSGYVYPDGYELPTSLPNRYKNLRNDSFFTSIIPKKIRVEYQLPEEIPKDTEFIVYTPIRMGKIFDNTLWTEDDPVRGMDAIGITDYEHQIGGVYQTLSCLSNPSAPLSYDINGEQIIDFFGLPDRGKIWINTSFFEEKLPNLRIAPGETGKVLIHFDVNSSGGEYCSNFYIRTPKWLEIEELYFGDKVNLIPVLSGKYYDPTRDTYYFNINVPGGYTQIHIQYKPKPDGTGSGQYDYQGKNAVASVRYWVDWDTGCGKVGDAKAVNPVWDYYLKNIQRVTYSIKQEAIVMNDMSLERQTRGLKVKGTTATLERTPINGTTVAAVNDDIDHHTYLPGDTGHIKVNATVLSNDYRFLYLLIRSDSLNHRFDLALRGGNNALLAFVNVNGTTKIFADEIQQSGDGTCIRFLYPNGFFPSDAKLDITLPFKAKTMEHLALFEVNAEAYMAKIPISNSLSPGADRYGQEYLTERWRIADEVASPGIFTNAGRSVVIQDGTEKEYVTMLYDDGISTNGYAFPNEYRPYKFPARLEIDMPTGIKATQLKILASSGVDETSNNRALVYPNPISVNPNSDNTVTTYTYDIGSKVDFYTNGYTGNYTSLINAGKWIIPDDLYAILFAPTIQVTSPAAPDSGKIKMRLYFKDRLDNFATVKSIPDSADIPFVNSTMRSQLTIPNNTFTVYDYDVNVPSVIAGIESSATYSGVRKAWLYVEGNIRNVRLQTKSGTPRTIYAIGNGHWVQLDDLTINTPADYALNYTLDSMKAAGDSVHVYMVVDFEDKGWTPTTSAPVVVNDAAHFGGSKIIITTPSTNSGVYGAFTSVPDTKVEYDKEYAIEISASQTGEAILINPEITLAIPAGQVLQTGAGKCQYQDAAGNWINIPSAALSYESQNNSLIVKSSEFNSPGKFILYKQASGKLNALKVRLTFKPSCDTPPTGFIYSASFTGKNLLGGAVEGMYNVNSKKIDPLINANSGFSTSIHLPNGTTFGGDNKRDTLKVTVNKYSGDTYDISPTDSLKIKLPKWLTITGAVKMTCADLSELNGVVDASYVREELNGNLRNIWIKLPSDVLNRDPQKGMSKPFTYSLPVTYVEDSRDLVLRNNPEQKIETRIPMITTYSPSCPSDTSLSLRSEDKKNIALLTMESDNPYIYNMVSLDSPFNIRITSSGFLGGWYKDAALNIPLATTDGGTAYTYPGTSTPDTIGIYIKPIFTQAYDSIHITLHTPPVNLYWRADATDNVWRNPANWTTGMGESEDRKGYLPALVTNVTLQSGASQYPALTDTVACKIIRFEHGSELARQDLLRYDSARVQLKVQANRWYMFAPSLMSMYSGDFYLNNPDPKLDGQTAYTMLFNTENPETEDHLAVGKWTGVFNTPNILLKPGSGLALWIDNGKDSGNHDEIKFLFPKNDENHYTYNPDRFPPGNISGTYPTPRPYNGRFVYENGNGQIAADGNIILQDVPGHTNGEILVGNPFMAHLNFNGLYTDNSGALSSNGYKLASGVTANGFIKDFYSYLRVGDRYLSTSPNPVDNTSGLIPPMQSFVISVKSGEKVTANIRNHTEISTAPADTFRMSSQETTGLSSLLNIIAIRGEEVSKTLILQNETFATSYVPSEDSYKLFISKVMDSEEVLKPVQVYTRSSDGYALDINCIGTSEQDITVPLCIRTSEKGEIVLNFSGMESFGEDISIHLYDTQRPGLIDLSEQPEYIFEKTEDDLYLENRFSLIIGKTASQGALELETASEASTVRILSFSPRKLRLVAENGKALGNIRITDAEGRMILDLPSVSSSIYEYQTPAPGIYVVRIGAEVKKVVSIR